MLFSFTLLWFSDSESSENGDLGSPTSPTKESLKFPAPKEVICTDIPIEMLQDDSKLYTPYPTHPLSQYSG